MNTILVLIQLMDEYEAVRPVFLGAELSVVGSSATATVDWHGSKVVWAVTGTAPDDAVERTRVLLDRIQPDLVLFSGTCEGLSPKSSLGDILVCTAITREEDQDCLELSGKEVGCVTSLAPIWDARYPRVTEMLGKPATVVTGTGVTVKEMPTTDEKKEKLAASGYDCVDGHGYGVVKLLQEADVPFVVARAVSRMPGMGIQPTRISEAMLSVAIMVDDITNKCSGCCSLQGGG